ncbi:CHRD domain-containing protein [Euzebya tangerina]|uniref:CHRD domain-containing protein n=1 Tax=Euzebya tangerina TaxID=591198 RepID=UPI000E30F265|nr:CHRD domain-containing protein [Euzebya tangerina]
MRTRFFSTGLILTLLVGLLAAAPAAAQEPDASVEVVDNDFSPNDVTIDVGGTVEWEWTGNNPHTVTSNDDAWEASPVQMSGTFEVTFTEPGTYDYFCSIHSGQVGSVTVRGDEGPVGPVDPENVSGDDPVETALSYSATLPDGSSANAIIGTSGTFPDSLASGSLQGFLDAPLLLTPTDDLDDRVEAELQRLQVTDVTILGGVDAVSQAVEDELAALVSQVTRLEGPTRIETALDIATQLNTSQPVDTVILARAFGADTGGGPEGSDAFADALGGGAVAAQNEIPVLLTRTDVLEPGVSAWLTDNQVQTVIIAGGTAAISDGVASGITDLGITVERRGGSNRVSTAIRLALGGAEPLLEPLADVTQPATVVQGEGELAWASGFAAAQTSPGGILLATGDIMPADTLNSVFATGAVRCGATLSDELCGQAQAAASVDGKVPAQYIAVMDSDQETPPNDTGASGTAAIYAAGPEGLCFTVQTFELSGPITVSHIHDGDFGVAGPPTITFTTAAAELAPGTRTGCVNGIPQEPLAAFTADPAAHYVNIHTDANPGGEIRGQVFEPEGLLVAGLNGDNEVPEPGDPDAEGVAVVWDTGVADELCYVVDQGGLTPAASMAHIHRGAAGENGDVVVPLDLGAGGNLFAHCDRGLDTALVEEILTTSSEFYVNVHNEPFPAGAIRGQLAEESRD